jgi:molybdopterin-guanine dinucleotide biosynthesis protein A
MKDNKNANVKIPAVVLAGAPAEPELRDRYSVTNRAAVPIAGKPMIKYVVDALAASSHIDGIFIVGDIDCDGAVHIVEPAGDLLGNLMAGINAAKSTMMGDRILVATSDIPFITAEAIDDFVDRCATADADLYYGAISREVSERRFPGIHRTYVRMAEGTVTGGNIVVLRPDFLAENESLLRKIFDARKKVFQMATLIGFGTLFRVVIARFIWARAISLPYLENTIGRIVHAKVKGIVTPFAEIGTDIDNVEQLNALEPLLASEGELK